MNAHLPLETRFLEKTTDLVCADCSFASNYESMRSFLKDQYYPWVQAQCPWFTDHGEKHIKSVIHTIDLLLPAAQHGSLNCLDFYVLLCSVIWHDVGMVNSRTNHAKESAALIAKIGSVCFPNITIKRIVEQIVRAHSGRDGWAFLRPSQEIAPCTHKTQTVYPQSLAALLRFADEISETRSRISPSLLTTVPAPQQVFWHFANAVTASKPEPERKRILLELEIDRSSAITRFPCPDDKSVKNHSASDGTISLIEYTVCRLEKINQERVYCFPYLTRYADIRTIDVRLCITDGHTESVNGDISLGDAGLTSQEYPNIPLFDRFFSSYPQFSPTVLAEGGSK